MFLLNFIFFRQIFLLDLIKNQTKIYKYFKKEIYAYIK